MAAPAPSLAEMEAVACAHLQRVAVEHVLPTLGGEPSGHRWTSPTQVHTDDDARAGQALHELFTSSFPGHGLTIEDRPPLPGDGVHEWFLDPIDGSANHLRGIPYVALSAGLAVEGEPVVGVIHDLVRDVTLSAHRGGGARVHDHGRVRPARVAPTERLVDAMAIVHLARRGPLLGLEGALAHLLWSIRKVRCMGSIALDLALIANGEADLLVTGRGTPQRLLDILGGLVIVAEAGGRVADADGRPWRGASRTLVAGPSALVDAFVALMADWDLEGWTAARAAPPRPRSPA